MAFSYCICRPWIPTLSKDTTLTSACESGVCGAFPSCRLQAPSVLARWRGLHIDTGVGGIWPSGAACGLGVSGPVLCSLVWASRELVHMSRPKCSNIKRLFAGVTGEGGGV